MEIYKNAKVLHVIIFLALVVALINQNDIHGWKAWMTIFFLMLTAGNLVKLFFDSKKNKKNNKDKIN